MKNYLVTFASCAVLGAWLCLTASGQVLATGSITGTIFDESGGVVPYATVVAMDIRTGAETKVDSAINGTFSVPALPAGAYWVSVTRGGFAPSELPDPVKVDAGKPSTVSLTLAGGGTLSQTLTVVGGRELVQPTGVVSFTVSEEQITQIPFASRDTLDWALLSPATNTVGRPRTSTINGLPKGAFSITINGLSVQDSVSKSGDGFFAWVRPRLDAIEEVTLITAAPDAANNGDGAAQLKFVTRRGSNDYHGSLYEYHRNPALNSNYYFNNLSGLQRDRVLLNQFGGRVGGPLSIPNAFNGKDRAFFFVNYEEFRLPEQTSRDRTILNSAAESGVFTTASGSTIDLFSEAAATNCNPAGAMTPCASTLDPTVQGVLSAIRASTSQGSVSSLDNNRQTFRFTNTGGQTRRFSTVRFDFNLSPTHTLENVWDYQSFRARGDFVNFADPAFPGLEAGAKGQNSNRFSNSLALRSVFTSHLINEARFGVLGGTSTFYPNKGISSYDYMRGFSFGSISTTGTCTGGFSAAGISCPTASITSKKNNAPVTQFTDNLTMTAGRHTISVGGSFSKYSMWQDTKANVVPSVTFGLDTTDPASAIFTRPAFAGISTADLLASENLYAVLTGRVTNIAGFAYVDETTGNLVSLGSIVERVSQRQFGLYAQDSWRVRSNLTVEAGLRWEVQFPFEIENRTYTTTTYAELFGVSGENNLFVPGVQTGKVTQFTQAAPGDRPYETDWKNFAPSFGFSYSPNWSNKFLHALTGAPGETVVRGGYSIAYVREGLQVISSMFGPITGANPGGKVDISRSVTAGTLAAGTPFSSLDPSSALLTPPASTVFPYTGLTSDGVNVFEPNLKTGYVQSWSFGVQRAIGRDNAIEIRYVGSRGVKLWEQVDINEVNIIENGFINEFMAAQANLLANIANGVGTTYRYNGPGTGTSPLPIMLAYFSGVNPSLAGNCFTGTGAGSCTALYSSTLFSNATLIGNLLPNNAMPQGFVSESPTGFAKNMINNTARRTNASNAGLPANLFVANPNYMGGGAYAVTNRGRSYYDGLTFQLRRRMAEGLLLTTSYTLGKATSNMFANHQAVFYVPGTLRNDRLDRGPSPFDIRHAFKTNWVYDLPVPAVLRTRGSFRKVVDGWSFNGALRWQSGSPFNLGNVQVVGMSREDLQDAVGIRQDPAGSVFYLPDDIILNTRRAFNTVTPISSGSNPNAVFGYSTLGVPTGRYIAPPSSNGCVQSYVGQCGFRNLILYGPSFFRTDLALAKRTALSETTNLEFRAEFLNAFNNVNFRVGDANTEISNVTNFSSASFGTTADAYRDLSTTNDPGGRMVQFVLRLNF